MFDNFLVAENETLPKLKRLSKIKKLPIILYGSGVYAQEVEAFLADQSLNVDACFVDDIFLENTHHTSAPIYSFEQIKSRYAYFVVVIAFCGDSAVPRKKLTALKCEQIHDILFIDCRFWQLFGDFRTFVNSHIRDFREVYGWLKDDFSKKIFVGFINTKLTYDATYLPPFFSPQHYFPEDLSEFAPNSNDIFVDGGAYSGDTLSSFLEKSNGIGCDKYIAFEPDNNNFLKLTKYVKENNLSFVEVNQTGLWNDKAILKFDGALETQSTISKTGHMKINVDSVDNLEINPSFIKMDIEGAELEALKGASFTIKKFKPKLAISLYHSLDHLLDIPLFLKKICPEYKFYMRIHSYMSEELVLYAIVPKTSKRGSS